MGIAGTIFELCPPGFGKILIFSKCSNDSKTMFWYFQWYKKYKKSVSLSIQLIPRSKGYLSIYIVSKFRGGPFWNITSFSLFCRNTIQNTGSSSSGLIICKVCKVKLTQTWLILWWRPILQWGYRLTNEKLLLRIAVFKLIS